MFQTYFIQFEGWQNIELISSLFSSYPTAYCMEARNWCMMYHTFQGCSKILSKIQGTFKDFKDRH